MPPSEYDVIIAKFEDMKEFVDYRLKQVETKLSNCDDCKNAATFRERLRSQWFHITALWAAMGFLAVLFYQHVIVR